jgi:excisionase family DNA binding protein
MDVHLFKALDSIIPNEHYDRRLSSMLQEARWFPGHDLPPKKPLGRVQADDGRSTVPGAFHLEPLLDTDEAAAIMKIHPKTLQRFARLGRIRGVHVGKLWRFRASEIDAWIDRQIAG